MHCIYRYLFFEVIYIASHSPIHTNIHTPTAACQPCKATASSSGAVSFRSVSCSVNPTLDISTLSQAEPGGGSNQRPSSCPATVTTTSCPVSYIRIAWLCWLRALSWVATRGGAWRSGGPRPCWGPWTDGSRGWRTSGGCPAWGNTPAGSFRSEYMNIYFICIF